MEFINSLFTILIFLFSVVIHEVSHGAVAYKLGDDTAKNAGRLTLNPIPHLDMVGSVLLPALLIITGSSFVIGWAKPVPYNPLRLTKDLKYGPLKVALAGPGSNMALAIIVGIVIRLFASVLSPVAVLLMVQIVLINVLLAIFNLIPIPPLDGSKILTILLPQKYSYLIQSMGLGGIFFVLIFLFLFSNLIFSATLGVTALIIGEGALQALI